MGSYQHSRLSRCPEDTATPTHRHKTLGLPAHCRPSEPHGSALGQAGCPWAGPADTQCCSPQTFFIYTATLPKLPHMKCLSWPIKLLALSHGWHSLYLPRKDPPLRGSPTTHWPSNPLVPTGYHKLPIIPNFNAKAKI